MHHEEIEKHLRCLFTVWHLTGLKTHFKLEDDTYPSR